MKTRKTFSIVLVMAMLFTLLAFTAQAEEAYSPNRMLTMSCTDNINPTLTFSLMYDDYMENGPYTLLGKVKLENLSGLAGSEVNKAFLDIVPAGQSPVTVANWTENTDGWVDLRDEDGNYIQFDNLTDDINIVFGLWYAAADFSIADFKIVDKDMNIMYSLANDVSLYANTNLKNPVGMCAWYGADYGADNQTTKMFTTTKLPEYQPNTIISMEPTAEEPAINPVIIIDTTNPAFSEGGPFTVRAKVKVEGLGAIPHDLERPKLFFDGGGASLAQYFGDTNGWVSLLSTNGSEISFQGNTGYYIFGMWYATGKYSIADLAIYNNAGEKIYSIEEDVDYQGEGTIPVYSTKSDGKLLYWAYGAPVGVTFAYESTDNPVEHDLSDYGMPVFEELVEDIYEDDEDTDTDEEDVDTGDQDQDDQDDQDEDDEDTDVDTDDEEVPKTGDHSLLYYGILLALLAGSSIILVRKYNLNKE